MEKAKKTSRREQGQAATVLCQRKSDTGSPQVKEPHSVQGIYWRDWWTDKQLYFCELSKLVLKYEKPNQREPLKAARCQLRTRKWARGENTKVNENTGLKWESKTEKGSRESGTPKIEGAKSPPRWFSQNLVTPLSDDMWPKKTDTPKNI